MADLLLGIDGGGSKTRALLADDTGSPLGRGEASSSNYQSVGFEAASAAIEQAIAAAFDAAGLPARQVVAACFGLAGVDRPDDQALWQRWLDQRGLAQRFSIVNDAELLLAAGTPEGWGAALICGTGSICIGRAPDGRTTRAGGWGYLIGDEGSGYDIAIQALRLATQTADGRAEAHALLQAVLEHWQLQQPEQLIGQLYTTDVSRTAIATLAGRVAALAEAGDLHAAGILASAASHLARLIEAVVRQLGLEQPPIALGGGLLGASTQLREGVLQHPGLRLGPASYVDDPALGALQLARRLLQQT